MQLFKALLTFHTVKADRLEVGRAGNFNRLTSQLAGLECVGLLTTCKSGILSIARPKMEIPLEQTASLPNVNIDTEIPRSSVRTKFPSGKNCLDISDNTEQLRRSVLPAKLLEQRRATP